MEKILEKRNEKISHKIPFLVHNELNRALCNEGGIISVFFKSGRGFSFLNFPSKVCQK